MNSTYLKTSNFMVKIVEDNNKICEVKFVSKIPPALVKNISNKILKQAVKELKEYSLGKRKKFDVPLDINGTTFQKQVWNALLKIPYGKTISYMEVASLIARPKAARAVGTACGKNNIPIIIPCHRVLATNNKLGGFSGGLNIKKQLLKLED